MPGADGEPGPVGLDRDRLEAGAGESIGPDADGRIDGGGGGVVVPVIGGGPVLADAPGPVMGEDVLGSCAGAPRCEEAPEPLEGCSHGDIILGGGGSRPGAAGRR